MKAGRNLDALVARMVVGWTWDDVSAWAPGRSRYARNLPGREWEFLPHYSTDMAAAWELVERFDTAEVRRVYKPGSRRGDFYWIASLTGPKAGAFGDASAATAPLAICLAALDAVDVEAA